MSFIYSMAARKIRKKILILLFWVLIVIIIWFISLNMEHKKKEHQQQTIVETVYPENIRVLLTDKNGSISVSQLAIQGINEFTIVSNGKAYEYDAGKVIHLDITKLQNRKISFVPKDDSSPCFLLIEGQDVQPFSYRGILECFGKDGRVQVVNELPVEEYLYGVVPSEMPSGYPKEALKVQAICARTYAYEHMDTYAYPDLRANVDDTIRYQVYGSILEQSSTNQAVEETRDVIITQEGEVMPCMYYSTSCKAIEKTEPWYSWSVTYPYDEKALAQKVQTCYQQYPYFFDSYSEGAITGIKAEQRNEDGYITRLAFETNQGKTVCNSDYAIRTCLCMEDAICKRQDGYDYVLQDLLPSSHFSLSFVTLDSGGTGLHIQGGGYGHGNGVSQNGAKHLANMGYDAQQILNIYLGNCVLDKVR